MSAVFFCKRRWLYIACCQLLAGVVVLCGFYALTFKYASVVWVGKSFYFVVSEDSHIEVGAYESRLDGGAGYLLEYEGSEYVAWSVYLKEETGIAVQANIDTATKLIKKEVSHLYFKSFEDKKRKRIVQSALNNFYGCIDILSQVLSRLDQGLTQGAVNGLLTTLQKQISYLGKNYQDAYPQFSKVCADVQASLEEIMNKAIYGKDLRYLLCGMCDAYIHLASIYTL